MYRICILLIFLSCNFIKNQIKPDYKVLFIGNSLTYSNNLPGLFTEEAKKLGFTVQTSQLARPNYALVDHLAEGKISQTLQNGRYDFVVVQQGPSSQADGRAMLLEAGSELQQLCAKNNSKLAFFMVWPAFENYHTFDGVIRNYSLAATHTDAILCPVGIAWKEHIDKTGDLEYYASDRFHPSLKGSTFAARIIAESLFGKKVVE